MPEQVRFVATDGPVIGSLCTGMAGLDLGVAAVLGGKIAWYSEIDPHAAAVLAARLPGVPNLGDLRAVDFATVVPVEVLTAGFPCQDISAAGRRAGIEKGARSGLWSSILDAVRVLRPRLVVVENVAALRWKNGGLDRVLAGLAEAGYDAVWRCVRAADIGAAHRRERVFLCAVARPGRCPDDADPTGPRRRATRPGRSRAQACGRASGEPQRRGGRGRPAPAGCVILTGSVRLLPAREAKNRTHGTGCAASRIPGGRSCLSPGAWGPVADTDRARRFFQRNPGRVTTRRTVSCGHATTSADPAGDRRYQRVPGATRLERRPDAAFGRHRRHHAQAENPGAEEGE
ncbi:DNA cytosine methyltransferase [Amycolatopsis japonica]|uniref:DNA cytosine methyltransferase n=1 Tax=Amycolatopsis japonica TaxID=208439 RepID=UPI003672FA5A